MSLSKSQYDNIFTKKYQTSLLSRAGFKRYTPERAQAVGIYETTRAGRFNRAATRRAFFEFLQDIFVDKVVESQTLYAMDTSGAVDDRKAAVRGFMRQFVGRTVRVRVWYLEPYAEKDPLAKMVVEGKKEKTFMFPSSGFNKFWNKDVHTFLTISSTIWWGWMPGWVQYDDILSRYSKIEIIPESKLEPPSPQVFAESYTSTCLIDSIRPYYEAYHERKVSKFSQIKNKDCKTGKNLKKEVSRAKCNLDRVMSLYDQFPDGVPEQCLQAIASDLKCAFLITLPFHTVEQEPLIHAKPVTKALVTHRLTNCKFNHVDLMAQQKTSEMVTLEEIWKLYEQACTAYKETGEFFTFSGDVTKKRLSSLTWRGVRSTADSEYATHSQTWEIENNIHHKSCTLAEGSLEFNLAREATHTPSTIDFGCPDAHVGSHVDMWKAYGNCHYATQWEGFAECMTDIRRTSCIVGLGLYRVTDLCFDKCDPALLCIIQKLNLYNCIERDGLQTIALPSPELKFLQSRGVTFTVLCGMWTQTPHMLKFHECDKFDPDVKEKSRMMQKEDGVTHYSKWVGCSQLSNAGARLKFPATKEFAEVMSHYSEAGRVQFFDHADDSQRYGEITFKKTKHRNRQHHAAQTFGYIRLMMIEQLLQMDVTQLIRVCVDGIYTKEHHASCVNVFSQKEIVLSKMDNQTHNPYTRARYCEPPPAHEYTPAEQFAGPRAQNPVECNTGEGGCGKTYAFCNDAGLINKLVISPSHKLASSIHKSYGVDVAVLARAVSTDAERQEFVHDHANILYDEVSQYNTEQKEFILKTYAHTGRRLIFSGDIGYQLPCIEGEEFQIGDIPCVNFTHNYRNGSDHRLTQVLQYIRTRIKAASAGSNTGRLRELRQCLNLFRAKGGQFNKMDTIKSMYTLKDIILSYTHKKGDKTMEEEYNLNCKGKKWYMEKACLEHSKGDIVVQDDKPPVSCRERHVYTVHCVQGETFENKIYIDTWLMHCSTDYLRLLYTAMSRARRFEQIVFLDTGEEVIDEPVVTHSAPEPVTRDMFSGNHISGDSLRKLFPAL